MLVIDKRYKVFGKTILRILTKEYYTVIIFFHIFKYFKYKNNTVKDIKKFLFSSKNNILYIDHMLGGGTAIYSHKKIIELQTNNTVYVLKYDSDLKKYVVYFPNKEICFFTKNIKKIDLKLFDRIIINNIVGYPNPFKLLNYISIHKKIFPKTKIDLMIHDFYCVCPCVHLLCKKQTCVKNNFVKCIKCQKNIDFWQNNWRMFLKNIPDKIIVFSESSRKILLSVYPELNKNIKIIPHVVSDIQKVKIKKHDTVNILVLGEIGIIKGAEIIYNMAKLLPKDVNIINIGEFAFKKPETKQFISTGKYDIKSLPNIVEKYQIDIAFISSIVPETFSFTTSECINMGLPVACFNIGAQAEKIKAYNKGLIISKIDAKTAIKEIIYYIRRTLK